MTALTRTIDAPDGVWRMRVYHQGVPIALSDLLPLLGYLGLRALDEHPYRFVIDGTECFVYDIGVRVPDGVQIGDLRHTEVRSAVQGLLAGTIEPDGFNRLILLAGLTATQVNVLRCYAKYAHQTGFTFSQGYVEDSLARLPHLARLLVDLFEARFDPEIDEAERSVLVEATKSAVRAALDEVPSLDDDRIGRTFLALVEATVRTSAYQGTPTTAFKFDPSRVPDLPDATPGPRDLRVLGAGRGCPPARRGDRPRRSAME